MNSLEMQGVYISCHITTVKYKNFKIINLTHTISILNSVLPLYSTRQDEQNKISFAYVLEKFKINLIYYIFEYVYIYNRSRFMST
jgi:hypothetical protein